MSRMLRIVSVFASATLLATASTVFAEGDPAKGAELYKLYCLSCHGETGDGQGPVGKSLTPPPRDFTKGDFKYGGDDQSVFEVISNGAASKGGSPLMAPWGAVIPEADRWSIVAYIRTLKK